MENYLLNDGKQLSIVEFQEIGSKFLAEHKKYFADVSFSLFPKIDGKSIGLLTVKNGAKLKNIYTGDLNITVAPDYRGIGVETVLFRKLSQWLNCIGDVRKAKFTINVNDLIALDLLLDICQNSIVNEEEDHEFFGAF